MHYKEFERLMDLFLEVVEGSLKPTKTLLYQAERALKAMETEKHYANPLHKDLVHTVIKEAA